MLFDAIIVVDAWDQVWPTIGDFSQDPLLKKEADIHSLLINSVLVEERHRGTLIIYHNSNGKKYDDVRVRHTLNKNIDVYFTDKLTTNSVEQDELNKRYGLENIVLCGFHLGRCIDNYYKILYGANYYICENLSQVYREDTYERNPDIKYCNWNGLNFEV